MTLSFLDLITATQTRTDKIFHFYLQAQPMPAPVLQQAMSYGILNGGKRIRPLLVYVTGHALGATLENLDAAACAVEFIHSYSLIHDDLPAMDNADLRRGKPACHRAFDEAMAILAGDALQAFVFQILASHPANLAAQQRLAMITTLSEASGPFGMAAGQALDMTIMDKNMTLEKLMHLYQLKTGALLSASVKLGMLAAEPQIAAIQIALEKYAAYLGCAFQIQDDLLDQEGDMVLTGKPRGLDELNNKMTYPVLVGVEKTREKIQELFDLAVKTLKPLGTKSGLLEELADYLLRRQL
jgi:farnesyl diphosphate synthase